MVIIKLIPIRTPEQIASDNPTIFSASNRDSKSSLLFDILNLFYERESVVKLKEGLVTFLTVKNYRR